MTNNKQKTPTQHLNEYKEQILKSFAEKIKDYLDKIRKDNTIWRINQDELNSLIEDEIDKLLEEELK